jgi:hypothetical protein
LKTVSAKIVDLADDLPFLVGGEQNEAVHARTLMILGCASA